MDIKDKILDWIANGVTGVSSMAMALKAVGVEAKSPFAKSFSHPSDGSDFMRCSLLVLEIPEIREKFSEIAKISPHWAAIIKNWDKIDAQNNYLEMTALMRKIYAGIK